MAKCLCAGQVFFANTVRVDERLSGVHADGKRAKELRYCLTISLCEKLSRCGGIVGNESARDAQAGARGESELALLVFRCALALKIVYPSCFMKGVEKSFERGRGFADAHRAIALVEIIRHPWGPDFARPDSSNFRGGDLLSRFRKKLCVTSVARASRDLDG
jgi:hypothetical protein